MLLDSGDPVPDVLAQSLNVRFQQSLNVRFLEAGMRDCMDRKQTLSATVIRAVAEGQFKQVPPPRERGLFNVKQEA